MVVLLSALFSSCESWLDIMPKSRVRAEELFETESGFREALFGIYTSASQRTLYGENLTMSFLDVLAQNYVINHNEDAFYYESIYDYNEQNVENRIASIWAGMYNVIANCNSLLNALDGKEKLFKDHNYSFFLAETKALRAFLHFDLLRLYAPSANVIGDQPAIPFVDQLTNVPFPQLSANEVLERIISELLVARGLLADIDPIGPRYTEYSEEEVAIEDVVYDKGFLLHRKNRLNYYAITGLLARVYLYKGDKNAAAKMAVEVIDSQKFNFQTVYDDDGENNNLDISEIRDQIFYEEIIFGLYNDKLGEMSRWLFATDGGLFIPPERLKMYFEIPSYGTIDERYRYQFEIPNSATVEVLAKYGNRDRTIPLIRLAEMYYIAAECADSNEEALDMLNTVRKSRGYEDLSASTDFNAELQKEYRKEFIGEGQLFYFFKRRNATVIPYSSITGSDKVYVLPIPSIEKEFGNIND